MEDARYMTMEDGSAEHGKRTTEPDGKPSNQFIDHLEKAMMRIENKNLWHLSCYRQIDR